MKKITKEWLNKTIKEVELEIENLRKEIARLRLESGLGSNKDTNLLFKKRKKLAQMLTILTQKKEIEEFQVAKNNS
jgi:ribosomal protein L29